MNTKPWYKSKTEWFNIAVLICAGFLHLAGLIDSTVFWAIATPAITNMGLRTITTQPLK